MTKYYLWINEAQAGPYSDIEVKGMRGQGDVNSETLYWAEGMNDWIPLGAFLDASRPPLELTPKPSFGKFLWKKMSLSHKGAVIVAVALVLFTLVSLIAMAVHAVDKTPGIDQEPSVIVEVFPAAFVVGLGVIIVLYLNGRPYMAHLHAKSGEATVRQRIVVKTYKGSQSGAVAEFSRDSIRMSELGYFPTVQTWVPGGYGCAEFLVALLLCFIVIGILIFIYMMIVKPPGTLTVTYQLRESA